MKESILNELDYKDFFWNDDEFKSLALAFHEDDELLEKLIFIFKKKTSVFISSSIKLLKEIDANQNKNDVEVSALKKAIDIPLAIIVFSDRLSLFTFLRYWIEHTFNDLAVSIGLSVKSPNPEHMYFYQQCFLTYFYINQMAKYIDQDTLEALFAEKKEKLSFEIPYFIIEFFQQEAVIAKKIKQEMLDVEEKDFGKILQRVLFDYKDQIFKLLVPLIIFHLKNFSVFSKAVYKSDPISQNVSDKDKAIIFAQNLAKGLMLSIADLNFIEGFLKVQGELVNSKETKEISCFLRRMGIGFGTKKIKSALCVKNRNCMVD